MPSLPTPRDLHVDTFLTELSQGYVNTSYIHLDLFPVVTVKKQSNIIPAYDQSYWFRDAAKLRAPGTKSSGSGWAVNSTDTYLCKRYSHRHEVSDEERENADAPFDMDRDATLYVTDKLAMRRERDWAVNFFTTSVWGQDKTGGTDFTVWSNYASSQPLVDLTGYMDDVEARIAVEPNAIVLGKQVWRQLRWHPDIMETIKFVQKAQVTEDIFASLLGIDKVRIGRAIYTTDAQGTAETSVSYSRIWGKHALLLYSPATPSLFQPAAGYTFTWGIVPKSLHYIKRMRDEEREVDIFEGNGFWDMHKTGANGGLFMSGAVA